MSPVPTAATLAAGVSLLLAAFELIERTTGTDVPGEVRELVGKIRTKYEPTAREILAALDLLGIGLPHTARQYLDAIARANEGHDEAAELRRAQLAAAQNELADKPATQTEEDADNG